MEQEGGRAQGTFRIILEIKFQYWFLFCAGLAKNAGNFMWKEYNLTQACFFLLFAGVSFCILM